MTEARHPLGGSDDQRRPALREGLRIIDVAGEGADGAMRIVDPVSGRSYSFDLAEQRLCRAADGTLDVPAIHARQKSEGGTLTEEDVAKFFRRLRVLGLLKPTARAAAAKETSESSELMARRRKERATQAAAAARTEPDPPARDGGLMARRRLVPGSAGAPAAAKQPGGMRERLAGKAPSKGRSGAPGRDLLARRRRELAGDVAPKGHEASPATAESEQTAPTSRPSASEAAKRPGVELLARRRKERATGSEPKTEGAKKPVTPTAVELLAQRRKERASDLPAGKHPPAEAAKPSSESARALMARRRDDLDSNARGKASEPDTVERPGAAPRAVRPPSVTAPQADPPEPPKTKLPAAANEVAPAAEAATTAAKVSAAPQPVETTSPALPDPFAKQRVAIAAGQAVTLPRRPDVFQSQRAAPFEGPAPASDSKDLLAERRKALIGPTRESQTSTTAPVAAAKPEIAADIHPRKAGPSATDPPAPKPKVAAAQPSPAKPKPQARSNETAAPAKQSEQSGPDRRPALRKPAETAAKAAMAAAEKAASAGAPRPAPPPRAAAAAPSVPPKKAARNSDLMVRRLRERTGRGIAPETGKAPGAKDIEAATRRLDSNADGPAGGDLDFDFMTEHDPAGGMGAGAGLRGGLAGGMGGGMRGAMMGGGMGAMGGGAMGGGMMGGMRGQMQQSPAKKMPGQLPLFAPQAFLRLLYILFYPLKYVLWAIVPLVVLAAMTVINNLSPLVTDIQRLTSDYSSITHLLISIFGVSLIARLSQGVAIVAHGGRVKMFGMMLALGILPRFTIDRTGIEALDRKGQLWAHGTPLLARLTVFAVGTLIWAMTRERGGILPDISLVLAQFGLVVFLITAWPLFLSDGQRWISLMLNEPKIMGKAAAALRYAFRGGELPPTLSRKDVLPLVLFALGTILTVLIFVGAVMYVAATVLVGEFRGLGFVLFMCGIGAFLIWLTALISARRGKRGNFDAEGFRKLKAGRGEFLATEPAADDVAGREALLPSRAKVIWALILCGLLAIAFRPYGYYTGGEVVILPLARGQAAARTEGEIVEIMVREGTVVQQGEVLARLSSWDQQADIFTTQAQLDGALASLARLEAGATREEIEVARKKLESAEASVAFTRAEAERSAELAATGVVSRAALEKAESALGIDLADLEVARANYNKVVAPATTEELAIARADVRRLEEQLGFERGEMERTQIVAPISGRVVTPDLQLRQGGYLRSGDVLLEIERTDTVTATILVTESDIGLVSVGDEVQLKSSGQSSLQIIGQVEAIAPSATDEMGYGKAIRVTASFDNSDGFLRSGMTGYAKIEGEKMRVWEAYLRSIRHFFQIEVWSWIP